MEHYWDWSAVLAKKKKKKFDSNKWHTLNFPFYCIFIHFLILTWCSEAVTMNHGAEFSFANMLKEIIRLFTSSRNITQGKNNKPVPASVVQQAKRMESVLPLSVWQAQRCAVREARLVNFSEQSYVRMHCLLRSVVCSVIVCKYPCAWTAVCAVFKLCHVTCGWCFRTCSGKWSGLRVPAPDPKAVEIAPYI